MCGICGLLRYGARGTYAGDVAQVIAGLKKMESHGCDSAGLCIAKRETGDFCIVRSSGLVDDLTTKLGKEVLPELPSDQFGCGQVLGHTRWATNGSVLEANCHPQVSDENNEFIVVHNGIVENERPLRELLLSKGNYKFTSETDTEVIAKLAHFIYHQTKKEEEKTFPIVIRKLMGEIRGAFSLVFFSSLFPGEVVATCHGAPFHIGLRGDRFVNVMKEFKVQTLSSYIQKEKTNPDGPSEYFLTSDPDAFQPNERNLTLRNEDLAYICSFGELNIFKPEEDAATAEPTKEIRALQKDLQRLAKGGYATFMLKEIMEQPQSLQMCLRGRIGKINKGQKKDQIIMRSLQKLVENHTFSKCNRIVFTGTGTSYNAILAARAILEEMTEVPIFVEEASNYSDRLIEAEKQKNQLFNKPNDIVVCVSQSGENEYTKVVLEHANLAFNTITLGITNVVGSTISKDTQIGCHVRAGPQVANASTKAYTSQVLAMNMFACLIGQDYVSLQEKHDEIIQAMPQLEAMLTKTLECDSMIQDLAVDLLKRLPHGPYYMIGRGCSVGTVMEGALKFKDVTSIDCQGLHAGELKHGPLAIIVPGMQIICVIPKDSVFEKCMSALKQITARGGRIVAITTEDCDELDTEEGVETVIKVPKTCESLQCILTVVPLQLLAYHMAILKGSNVDNPKHLL